MKGLIQKSGYIKPGSGGGHYAEYIATRDGVELMEAARQVVVTWSTLRSVPALTVCSLRTVLLIWSKPWRRSTHTPVRYGPSSTH